MIKDYRTIRNLNYFPANLNCLGWVPASFPGFFETSFDDVTSDNSTNCRYSIKRNEFPSFQDGHSLKVMEDKSIMFIYAILLTAPASFLIDWLCHEDGFDLPFQPECPGEKFIRQYGQKYCQHNSPEMKLYHFQDFLRIWKNLTEEKA